MEACKTDPDLDPVRGGEFDVLMLKVSRHVEFPVFGAVLRRPYLIYIQTIFFVFGVNRDLGS